VFLVPVDRLELFRTLFCRVFELRQRRVTKSMQKGPQTESWSRAQQMVVLKNIELHFTLRYGSTRFEFEAKINAYMNCYRFYEAPCSVEV
jgi:hypothetical protein